MGTITNLRMIIVHFLASKDIKMYYRDEFTTWRDVFEPLGLCRNIAGALSHTQRRENGERRSR